MLLLILLTHDSNVYLLQDPKCDVSTTDRLDWLVLVFQYILDLTVRPPRSMGGHVGLR